MGFSGSWIAIKNKSTDLVLADLELNSTGKFLEFPEEPIVATQLDTGWYLVVTDQFDHDFTQYQTLSNLSIDCEVISCAIEEHVMVSSAEYWKDGSVIWSIQHDAQEDFTNLTTSGVMPKEFESIRKEQVQKQELEDEGELSVDYYFEIPLQTANSIVGYKHDETVLGEDAFEILEAKPKSKKVSNRENTTPLIEPIKPWWRFW